MVSNTTAYDSGLCIAAARRSEGGGDRRIRCGTTLVRVTEEGRTLGGVRRSGGGVEQAGAQPVGWTAWNGVGGGLARWATTAHAASGAWPARPDRDPAECTTCGSWARPIGGAAVRGARGGGGVEGPAEFSGRRKLRPARPAQGGPRRGRGPCGAGGLGLLPRKERAEGHGSGGPSQGRCKGAAPARESKSGVRFCGAGSTAARGGNGRGRCGLNQQGQRARTEERASR